MKSTKPSSEIQKKKIPEWVIKNLRYLNSLADLRIHQLKEEYGQTWWEASRKDETYKMICKHIALLKIMVMEGKLHD